jgi:hypothetical protein
MQSLLAKVRCGNLGNECWPATAQNMIANALVLMDSESMPFPALIQGLYELRPLLGEVDTNLPM